MLPVCSGDETDIRVILINHQNLHLGLGTVKKGNIIVQITQSFETSQNFKKLRM